MREIPEAHMRFLGILKGREAEVMRLHLGQSGEPMKTIGIATKLGLTVRYTRATLRRAKRRLHLACELYGEESFYDPDE